MNKDKRKKIGEFIFCVAAFVFALVMMIGLLFGALWKDLEKEEMEKIEVVTTTTKSLASVDYANGINGTFCLGYSSISEKQYYIAYEILEDDGKKLFKMPVDKTTIYDTLIVDSQAYVEIDENDFGIVEMRLYVPQGTITQKYDLSLDGESKFFKE